MEQVRTNWLQKAVAIIASLAIAMCMAIGFAPAKAYAADPVTSFSADITYNAPTKGGAWVSPIGAPATITINGATYYVNSGSGSSVSNDTDGTLLGTGDTYGAKKYTVTFVFEVNAACDAYPISSSQVKLNGAAADGTVSGSIAGPYSGINTVGIKITYDFTEPAAPTDPAMTYPNGQVWTKGSTGNLIFKPESEYEFDDVLYIDGEIAPRSAFDVPEDGNVVTLKASYLEQLSVGNHTIKYQLYLGRHKWVDAKGTFTIKAAATTNPDPISIDTVKITGATLSFKAGDAPKFTAKSSEPGMYYVYVEEWDEVGSDRYITSSAFFNRDKNKLISKFEAGKSYTYSVWVKPYSVYAANGDFLYYKTTLSNVKKLVLNGKTITLAASQKGDLGADVGIWLYKVASFKIAPAAAPAPVEQNPVVKDESGLSGNQLEDRKDLSILLAKGTPKSKTSIKLSWLKFTGATGYEVYQSFCDGKRNFKKVKEVSSSQALKHTVSKLKKNRAYKFFVVAYKTNGKAKTYLSKSPTIHVAMSFDKKTNAKSISVKKAKVALKVKGTHKIKASMKLQNPRKKALAHAAKFRYYSDNSNVATVSKSGKVVAKGKGSCNIYVTANNGVYKKIKVTVRR